MEYIHAVKQKSRTAHILWRVVFVLFFAMLMYKCRFGFGYDDEAFYLTIPYRLCQGDGLFINEYHLSQMSSVLIYPFMKLYLRISPSTDGIILSFRYIFTVLHRCSAIFLYIKLKDKGYTAVFVSLLYLLFTPFGIMALSYNSMGIALMCISGVMMYTPPAVNRVPYFVLTGMVFAGAVLCCPYLVLVYIYYLIAVALMCALNKKYRNVREFAGFLRFSAGCAVAAMGFVLFVFSRCGISRLFDVLPSIMNDPEHPMKSITSVVVSYISNILRSNNVSVVVIPLTALCALSAFFVKDKEKFIPVYLMAGFVLTAVYTVPFVIKGDYPNFLMFPLILSGVMAFSICPYENIKEMAVLFVPGLIYGFCLSWSSNQRFYVISNGALLSSIGSALMIYNTFNVYKKHKKYSVEKTVKRVYATGLALFIICVAFSRYNSVFREGMPMSRMTERVTVGANKGVLTTARTKTAYENQYAQTRFAREYRGDNVLYFSENTYLYLSDEKSNASFSAWISGTNDISSDKLVEYYGFNPDKIPDIVYCDKSVYNRKYSIFEYLKQSGYKVTETDSSYFFTK